MLFSTPPGSVKPVSLRPAKVESPQDGPGQRNDVAFAHELIDGFEPDATIADKGYDADHLAGEIA
jgi:hypothetical protein